MMKKSLTPFQIFEIVGCSLFSIYFSITDTEHALWYVLTSLVASICGITCVVLCAGGNISQYIFGLINIVTYSVIAYSSNLYGEVMLNVLYYLPCQFIGFYLWKKNESKDSGLVKGRGLKNSIRLLILLASALSICAYQTLLNNIGGNLTWLDSSSTILSIVANALMILRYYEQWIIWIFVNLITVVMWGIQGDTIMTTMWAFYLMNAIFGLITWQRKLV